MQGLTDFRPTNTSTRIRWMLWAEKFADIFNVAYLPTNMNSMINNNRTMENGER